ncbi:hypothetical protein KY285_035014 [Solanum tuberosum]|nr:hypothetical protein KY285_035014 [Solanum tuberosum]
MENIFQDEISTWLPLYSYEERKFVKFPATRPTVDIREILTKRTSMVMPPFSCLINRSEPQYYSYGVFDMNGNIYFDEISIWFLMHPSKKRTDGKFSVSNREALMVMFQYPGWKNMALRQSDPYLCWAIPLLCIQLSLSETTSLPPRGKGKVGVHSTLPILPRSHMWGYTGYVVVGVVAFSFSDQNAKSEPQISTTRPKHPSFSS